MENNRIYQRKKKKENEAQLLTNHCYVPPSILPENLIGAYTFQQVSYESNLTSSWSIFPEGKLQKPLTSTITCQYSFRQALLSVTWTISSCYNWLHTSTAKSTEQIQLKVKWKWSTCTNRPAGDSLRRILHALFTARWLLSSSSIIITRNIQLLNSVTIVTVKLLESPSFFICRRFVLSAHPSNPDCLIE